MSNLNVNNLTSLAGQNGTIGVSSSLNVSGSITLTGNVTANGNIVLGDSTNDRITFDAKISSSLIPNQNSTSVVTGHDLGASNRHWNNAFIRVISASHSVTASVVKSPSINTQYINNTAGTTTHFVLGDTTQLLSSNGLLAVKASFTQHVTASGTVKAEHLHSTDDAVIDDDLTVGGDVLVNGQNGVSASIVHGSSLVVSASKGRFEESLQVGGPLTLEGLPTSEPVSYLNRGELYTLSGSQIFTGSAFIQGHADQIFASPGFSSSLFVFQKA